MSKLLVLPGYACKSDIWEKIRELDSYDIFKQTIFIDWPKEKLKQFYEIEDFSSWIAEEIDLDEVDAIIGHSMGGLVALDLALKNLNLNQVIAIESFVTTPSEFFQNLVMEELELNKAKLLTMLREEAKFYREELAEKLKILDWSNRLTQIKAEVFLIYCDRGKGKN